MRMDYFCKNVIPAATLCKVLGLHERFFKDEANYLIKLEKLKVSNALFIQVPAWLEALINEGYMGFVLEGGELKKLDKAVHIIFKITSKTSIGLFKYDKL